MKSYKLTKLQEKVIGLNGKVVLKACPGSGKTFVVANKILREIKQWHSKNSGIAILSFTNVASIELEKQINKISGDYKIDYPHYLGTLDSFVTQNIFMPFGHLIMKCEERPSIIQDYSIGVHEYAKLIWRKECYDNFCVPMDFYYDKNGELCCINKDISHCPCTKSKPCIQLKTFCYNRGYATYSDVNSIAIRILKGYPDICGLLSQRYPYVFVDEAQDTSSEQMEIIELLVNAGSSNIMLIGDPDQAIYEWRDADPSVFIDIFSNPKWTAELLNENFRCSQYICNATKVFSSLPEISIAIGETSDYNYKPRIIKYDVKNKEALLNEFLEICKSESIEVTEDNVAVLVRGKSGLLGKDYSQLVDLWQSPLAIMLSEATFSKENKLIKRTVDIVENALYYAFVDSQTSNVIDYIKISERFSLEKWNSMIFEFSMSLPKATISLKQWKIDVFNLIKKFTEINHLDVIGNIEIKTKVRTRDEKYKDFLEQPIQDFYAKAYNLGYLNTTIHSVKGCTFEAVLLVIGQNGKLTSNIINNRDINSEPIRTAYVGLTRARKVLVVAIPNTIKDKNLIRFPKEDWEY